MTVAVVILAAFGAIGAASLGVLLLRGLRNRPIRVQVLGVALSAVITMIGGVVTAAGAMFIDTEDLHTLVVVVLVSGSVAVGAALQLAGDIGVSARHVGELARGLLKEPVTPTPAGAANELAHLASELAAVSRQLEQSRARERALDHSRRELVAWVSHDLRSPLATVRAMAEALDDGVVDDGATVERYHHQMRRDAERLTKLVDDLFELSRINAQPTVVSGARAPLDDVVRDALTCAEALAEFKGVAVLDDLQDVPRVPVPARELERVLHNLFDNAIRHTAPGGTIVFGADTTASTVVLSVVDECGGIPEPDIDRVFDVAFRGDVARSRDDRGGGLGLAIAKGLVEAQAGTLEVTNLEHGCQFSVALPIAHHPE